MESAKLWAPVIAVLAVVCAVVGISFGCGYAQADEDYDHRARQAACDLSCVPNRAPKLRRRSPPAPCVCLVPLEPQQAEASP